MNKDRFKELLNLCCKKWNIGFKFKDKNNRVVFRKEHNGHPVVLAFKDSKTLCEHCDKRNCHQKTYRRIDDETDIWEIKCNCGEGWTSEKKDIFQKK